MQRTKWLSVHVHVGACVRVCMYTCVCKSVDTSDLLCVYPSQLRWLYFNILKDFFWNSKVVLKLLYNNQQYAPVKHELIESESVSRGKFPFTCRSPTHREFRVKGQPPTPYEGWICANHFFLLMGGLWNNQGVVLRTAPFEAGRDWESFPKYPPPCGQNFNQQLLCNFLLWIKGVISAEGFKVYHNYLLIFPVLSRPNAYMSKVCGMLINGHIWATSSVGVFVSGSSQW